MTRQAEGKTALRRGFWVLVLLFMVDWLTLSKAAQLLVLLYLIALCYMCDNNIFPESQDSIILNAWEVLLPHFINNSVWNCQKKSLRKCSRSLRYGCLVSEIQQLHHFKSEDMDSDLFPLASMDWDVSFPYRSHTMSSELLLGLRRGLLIKSSPAGETDSVFTPSTDSANIVPIIDMEESKPHSERSVLSQTFNSKLLKSCQ